MRVPQTRPSVPSAQVTATRRPLSGGIGHDYAAAAVHQRLWRSRLCATHHFSWPPLTLSAWIRVDGAAKAGSLDARVWLPVGPRSTRLSVLLQYRLLQSTTLAVELKLPAFSLVVGAEELARPDPAALATPAFPPVLLWDSGRVFDAVPYQDTVTYLAVTLPVGFQPLSITVLEHTPEEVTP